MDIRINFFGLLTILFITLKLIGVITWNWTWVLAPIWMPLAFVLIIITVFSLVSFISAQR
jgi:hypothetical protein